MGVNFKTLILTILSLALLSSCTTAEERRLRYERDKAYYSNNASKVRSRLHDISGGQTLTIFKIDVNREYFQTAYNYITELGGTVISSGRPQFLLDINVRRNYRGNDFYDVTVESKIISERGVDGNRTILFVSSREELCYKKCTRQINGAIYRTLHTF